MPNLLQITPFMHVPDVGEAVRFLVERLGFHATVHVWDYAYVERDGVALRILKASDDSGEQAPPGNRLFMYYIDVRDVAVDGARTGWQSARLRAGHRVRPPCKASSDVCLRPWFRRSRAGLPIV